MKVAVLGLARDCERSLPHILDSIDGWGVSARVLIGEDGSSDGTRSILESRAELVDTTPSGPPAPRLSRMARARQRVKEAYESGDPADLVLVIDMDDNFAAAISPSWLQGALERLRGPNAPFALSATSEPYYDLLAFESEAMSFAGLDQQIKLAQRNPLTYRRFKAEHIYAHQKLLTRKEDIWCISAFNGVAAYLGTTYRDGQYEGPEPSQVCEHVIFHRELAKGGARMVVDASLSVPTPREHVEQKTLVFYTAAIRKMLNLR